MADIDSTEFLPVSKDWTGYFGHDINKSVHRLVHGDPLDFEAMGRDMALTLFHEMAERVPAYKDFLAERGINHHAIKTDEDFLTVPWIDKENYIKRYPLAERCWDGQLQAPIISASSGSSGQSTYWPRSNAIELETSYIYELFLSQVYDIANRKTLLINGFSMGIYIGGTFTLNCCMRLAQKGYPLTIMTPGINLEEILRSVHELGDQYDQIIMSGYPPFVRDILDEGIKRGIDWKKLRMRFYFASESLSEDFRKHIFEMAGVSKDDYYTASLNLYGTADAAIAGHEMPLGTYLRTLFSAHPARNRDFFGKTYVPSLNQYHPYFKHFEIDNGELLFSSRDNAVPMVRYNIHDRGGILRFNDAVELAETFGHSLSEIKKHVPANMLWRLPFVYLFGRSDFTVTLYGLNVYPENIRSVMETDELIDLTTGKFVLETANHPEDQSQYLLVHIELREGIKPSASLEKLFADHLQKGLRHKNSEYNHLFSTIGKKARPVVDLREYQDVTYFQRRTKQQWVKK